MYSLQNLTLGASRSAVLMVAIMWQVSAATAQSVSKPVSVPPVTPTVAVTTSPLVLARGPGGVIVSEMDVVAEMQRAPEASRQVMLAQPDTIQQIVSNLLVRRVLAKEAERDGLPSQPLVAATLAVATDRVLSDARLLRLDAQNAPSDAAVESYARSYYQANTEKFQQPAQTRARHILLKNEGKESLQRAKDLLAKLRAGASFEDLAKSESTDPGSAARGGDLGFFSSGQMVRPFEDAVNTLAKPGDLSEPVESQFGWHIIRLEERREKGMTAYAEVREQLLSEARTSILNEARVQKVLTMNREFNFERAAIETMASKSKP